MDSLTESKKQVSGAGQKNETHDRSNSAGAVGVHEYNAIKADFSSDEDVDGEIDRSSTSTVQPRADDKSADKVSTDKLDPYMEDWKATTGDDVSVTSEEKVVMQGALDVTNDSPTSVRSSNEPSQKQRISDANKDPAARMEEAKAMHRDVLSPPLIPGPDMIPARSISLKEHVQMYGPDEPYPLNRPYEGGPRYPEGCYPGYEPPNY